MNIVIDIDGTLCDEDDPDVSKRRPILHHIEKLNALYRQGHTIEIYTSRGMKSTNNNAAESDLKYRELTERQLVEWGVLYTRLYFGKPNADIYIDNKNVLLEDFFK